VLEQARRRVPIVGHVLFEHRFPQLGGRRLVDLFDLASVAPARLARVAATARSGRIDLRGLSPSTQLAVFSHLRDSGAIGTDRLDRLMSDWLRRLGARRHSLH
jgi:hypothetical protein